MTTASLVDQPTPQELAEELYRLLSSLDPALWSADAVSHAKEALVEVRQQARALVDHWSAFPSRSAAEQRLRAAVAELVASLPDPYALGENRAEWKALYDQISPLYETIATALKQEGQQVAHLTPMNWLRSFVHAGIGVGVAVLFESMLTPLTAVLLAGAWCAWAWTLETTRRYSRWWNEWLMWFFGPIAREHEYYRVNSATWFGTGLLVIAITAPNLAGMLGLLTIAVGDPVAGLVGRRFGRTKLVHGRSLEGSLAFFASSLLVGLGWTWAWYDLHWLTMALLATTAAATGALTELFARRVDDNLAVPVLSAWATTLVAWTLGVL